MKKRKLPIFFIITTVFLTVFFLILLSPELKNDLPKTIQQQTFVKAQVLEVISVKERNNQNKKHFYQELKILILSGNEKGKIIKVQYGNTYTVKYSQLLKPKDRIILSKINNDQYTVWDRYRLPQLLVIVSCFLLFIVLMTGKKGVGSIIGMLISIIIILKIIIPHILNGTDALFISILGSFLILFSTIYLAHGFSKQTTIAVVSTFLSLILTGILSVIFVNFLHLTGLGSEEIYSLQLRFADVINFKGLLLGGIIIGTLGVLDDITTTQSATIFSLAEANPSYDVLTLIKKGFVIGTEHITSLVNTLILAYAGASIGIFILFVLLLETNTQPLFVLLNSEFLIEEIVRTLAGSIGLILAVPITTILAAFFSKNSIKII